MTTREYLGVLKLVDFHSVSQIYIAPVAQLDRVPGYEPGGREFESLRARQLKQGLANFGEPFVILTLRNLSVIRG